MKLYSLFCERYAKYDSEKLTFLGTFDSEEVLSLRAKDYVVSVIKKYFEYSNVSVHGKLKNKAESLLEKLEETEKSIESCDNSLKVYENFINELDISTHQKFTFMLTEHLLNEYIEE